MADRGLPFALVTFPSSAEAQALLAIRPDDLQQFYVEGVPRSFVTERYRAAPSLSVATDAAGRRLIKFGTTILDGAMCLDPATGQVIQLFGRGSGQWFVNSTLAAFTASIREVSKAFPFYQDGASSGEVDAAARRVAEIIGNIDGEAVAPDRYWSTFLDDIRTGDWATGDVVQLVASDY